MQVTAYYDKQGNIVDLIAGPDDAPPARLRTRIPLASMDFKDDRLTAESDPAEIHARLTELQEGHRIDVDQGAARLVERNQQ